MIFVTGGAGFIGANFVLDWLDQGHQPGEPVVNLDKLTYAGNLQTLASVSGDARHHFVEGDIGDRALVASLLHAHQPRAVINFAAESHMCRSIDGPAQAFFTCNDFVGNDPRALVLGDNLPYRHDFVRVLADAHAQPSRATVFAYQVQDPQGFGAVAFDALGKASGIEEKPLLPKSNYAVTGVFSAWRWICADILPSLATGWVWRSLKTTIASSSCRRASHTALSC